MTVRPPIVTVMGHVDHGKSTLIETLRQINITGQEAGGITQAIGAYQLNHQGKLITVIDTPGHAAFTKMRSRGARVTDLVILLVAADDGVKPQTKEAIGHIKEAKVPFLVAINKIDLPEANVEKVKAQLAENEVYVEGYGGDVVCVPISAKKKQNLDQLLEMVLLLAEMQELKSDPAGELEAVVIEAKLDPTKGPVATLLIKNGTLRLGQAVWAQAQEGKVKALQNDAGEAITQATPGQPVVMLGFKSVPAVGARVTNQRLAAAPMGGQASELGAQKGEENKPKLKLIIKADVAGSLEAIKANLSDEVEIIAAGVGEVGEADVLLAETTGAKVIAFNVGVIKAAARLAETESISLKTYRIIYELLDDIAKEVGKLLEPTLDATEVGRAVIKAEFQLKATRIAGCQVSSGVLAAEMPVQLQRQGQPVGESQITSLQQGQEPVKQVGVGGECGVALSPALDFKIGDMLVSYRKLSVEE
jgi:translation initiation factor IF-2